MIRWQREGALWAGAFTAVSRGRSRQCRLRGLRTGWFGSFPGSGAWGLPDCSVPALGNEVRLIVVLERDNHRGGGLWALGGWFAFERCSLEEKFQLQHQSFQ